MKNHLTISNDLFLWLKEKEVHEVLLHRLLIKIKSSLEALQFFTVTVLQAFTARED